MKAKLIALYLQRNSNNASTKLSNQGFTLIELLVVIIIIGILSAIAIPSLLSQTNKAKQTEAKVTLSSLNRAQQTYYLERSEFITDAANIGALGIGVKTLTSNYQYEFAPITGDAGVTIGVAMLANPVGSGSQKSYASGIGIAYQAGAGEASTLTTLCESTQQNQDLDVSAIAVTPGIATTGGGSVECAAGTVVVK